MQDISFEHTIGQEDLRPEVNLALRTPKLTRHDTKLHTSFAFALSGKMIAEWGNR